MSPRPLVSVCMITYNHAPFIAQAIESVLAQKTSFPFDVFIGEDKSTDGTRDIVKSYADKHPDLIHAVLNETNLGMHQNFEKACEMGRGPYFAILEGDDYWTSEHKLQRQVDALEANKNWSGCFHNVQVLEGRGSGFTAPLFTDNPTRGQWQVKKPSRPVELADILEEPHLAIHTSSVMYRNVLTYPLPEWFNRMPGPDAALAALHAETGPLGYIDEVMSAYRPHPGGVTFSRNPFKSAFTPLLQKKTLSARYNTIAPDAMRKGLLAATKERDRMLVGYSVAHMVDKVRVISESELNDLMGNGDPMSPAELKHIHQEALEQTYHKLVWTDRQADADRFYAQLLRRYPLWTAQRFGIGQVARTGLALLRR